MSTPFHVPHSPFPATHPPFPVPRYRLTRLGEYFQPKILSMLMGYTMANSMGLGDALKTMGGKLLAKLKG